MSKTSMTKAEREAFLAETHVGVFSVTEPERGPLSIPVWYHYEPGGVVRFTTGGGSKKAKLMRASGRASLLVQTEAPPYKYASVEGPVRIAGAPDYERDVRAMAIKSLGKEMTEAYLVSLASEYQDIVLVELTPERWFTVDYAKAFG